MTWFRLVEHLCRLDDRLHQRAAWLDNLPGRAGRARAGLCRWVWSEFHIYTFWQEWHDKLCPACGHYYKMVEVVEAAVRALEYASEHYMPSASADAEMWAFVNGCEGGPDIQALLKEVKKEGR